MPDLRILPLTVTGGIQRQTGIRLESIPHPMRGLNDGAMDDDETVNERAEILTL